jgi:hypothetical protein
LGAIEFAVADQGDGLTLDDFAKGVRFARSESADSMNDHEDNPGGNRGEKGRRAVDGARQHRADQNDEDGVERGLLRERAPIADSDQGKADNEDEEAADGYLEKRQFSGLAIRAQEREEKILERIHKKVSPEPRAARVSKDRASGDESIGRRKFVFSMNPKLNQGGKMPRGDKSSYTSKQKRKAEHIEEGYEKRGVSKKEAEKRAWATVNKSDKGGKKSGSGRGKKSSKAPARKGGKKGGKKSGGKKKR